MPKRRRAATSPSRPPITSYISSVAALSLCSIIAVAVLFSESVTCVCASWCASSSASRMHSLMTLPVRMPPAAP